MKAIVSLILLFFSVGCFALPACWGSIPALWNNCEGAASYYQNAATRNGLIKYIGEWKNGQHHGKGVAYYNDGAVYSGDFQNGRKHGRGEMSNHPKGNYSGFWWNGFPHGTGTFTFPDGAVHKGYFDFNKTKEVDFHLYVKQEIPRVYNADELERIQNAEKKKLADEKKKKHLAQERKKIQLAEEARKRKLVEEKRKKLAEQKRKEAEKRKLAKERDKKLVTASSGTGFAVSIQGHLITNHHVIDGCQEVKIHTPEKVVSSKVMSFDVVNDLALLKGDFKPKSVFTISDKKQSLLEDIYVAGFPFGEAVSSTVKVTKGIVSSLSGLGNNFSQIQIDAALQPGNSGGPILDKYGQVIGVAVAKLDLKASLDSFGVIPENTNFGIKANVVQNLLDSQGVNLVKEKRRLTEKSTIAKKITDGTYFLSCWMTYAQIKKMKTKKVMFENLQ